MIANEKPDLMEWKLMKEVELNKLFELAKQKVNYSFSDMVFFLTEASKDYLICEGRVYKRSSFGELVNFIEVERK